MRAPLRCSTLLAAALAVACTALPAHAEVKGSGIVGVDAMTATVFQEGQSSFSGLALRLRLREPGMPVAFEVLPTIEYWQNTSKVSAFDIKTLRRDATLGADARWVFTHKNWQPYAGAGMSLHFLSDEVRAPSLGIPHATHGVTKGAVDVLGGLQFDMSEKLGSFIEAKFLNVTQYRQFKFNTGLSWNF